MKVLRHIQQSISCRTAGILISGSLLFSPLPAIAQASFQLNLPNLSAPGNRESGATRSTTCIAPQENLIALVPESNYGLTHSGYPTFYFYLPPTNAPLIKFVMYNETTNELFYEGQFSIKGNTAGEGRAGIVGITLPNNGLQKPLEVGQSYVWYLTVVCDPDAIDQSGNAVIETTVARVGAPSEADQAPTTDLPRIYAEAGLWYDALAASAALKQVNNTASWNTLLRSVSLERLIPISMLSEETSPETTGVSGIN